MRLRGIILGMSLLLAFQSLGYYVAFVAQVGLHRTWVADHLQDLPDESLVFYQLTDPEYQGLAWDGTREFWKDGIKHDLKVAQQSADGSWQVLCMRDEAETRLLLAGNHMMAEAESNDSDNGASLPLLMGFPGIVPPALAWRPLDGNAPFHTAASTDLADRQPSIPAPPPQTV